MKNSEPEVREGGLVRKILSNYSSVKYIQLSNSWTSLKSMMTLVIDLVV